MLKLVCWVESEDYWNFNTFKKQNAEIQHFGYTFEVQGGLEAQVETKLILSVVELLNLNISIGFCVPDHIDLDGEFELGFICQDKPTEDVSFVVSITPETKNASYSGSELEKMEYIGYTLEKFYEEKSVIFYLYNFKGDLEHNQP